MLSILHLVVFVLCVCPLAALDYLQSDAVLVSAVQRSCVVLLADVTEQRQAHVLDIVEHSLVDSMRAQAVPVFYASSEFVSAARDHNSLIRLSSTGGWSGLMVAPKTRPEMNCLLPPTNYTVVQLTAYAGEASQSSVLDFLNSECNLYMTNEPGELNRAGRARQHILQHLYSVPDEHTTFAEYWQSKCHQQEEGSCESEGPADFASTFPSCEELDELPDADEFFRRYVATSTPVIIRNAVAAWPARERWTNDYLRALPINHKLHVKLTPPIGHYEGVEPMAWWNTSNFQVPPHVAEKIRHLDVVMVRPHGADLTLDELLDLVEHKTDNASLVSAYMEYTNVNEFMQDLSKDAPPPPAVSSRLRLALQNVWLSDGNTLGKLHFDPYDNILAMVSGSKHVLLVEPWHNARLYEGRIIEGTLRYVDGAFERGNLQQTTANTMTPVDVLKWNQQKYPLFGSVRPLHCSIGAGDALYMPAFWWHEVRSRPDPVERRNLAVNFWYEPFLQKLFPCESCPFDVNPIYRPLLDKFPL